MLLPLSRIHGGGVVVVEQRSDAKHEQIVGPQHRETQGRLVDIGSLKEWAQEKLDPGSALRSLILSEPQLMDSESFVAKVQSWLLLARNEEGSS